jgi:hypothetical protein
MGLAVVRLPGGLAFTATRLPRCFSFRFHRVTERPTSKKLEVHIAWIDLVLEGDRIVHKKQRHTALRIFERLRDGRGYSGGYTIVREHVAAAMLRSREMFVPLSHRPGQAQADFGEADGYVGGKKGAVSLFLHGPAAWICAPRRGKRHWRSPSGASGRQPGWHGVVPLWQPRRSRHPDPSTGFRSPDDRGVRLPLSLSPDQAGVSRSAIPALQDMERILRAA